MRSVSILAIPVLVAGICFCSCSQQSPEPAFQGDSLRLLYWNIQNGMWDGQGDNYDRFVDFVRAEDPDVCVWCEAQSIYKTDSDETLPSSERYLTANWTELAARYGHRYWAAGGHRDNYPQVITSKYPIGVKLKTTGDSKFVVSHGAGWFTVDAGGKTLNIVSLHLYPQSYAFGATDKEKSTAENGGDKYRAQEIRYICEHTIGTVPTASDELWMMMGDFNARSRVDNATYKYPEDSPKFLVHDYVRGNTPYLDVIAERNPGKFISSTGGTSRIDYIYCTKPLYDRITKAQIIKDSYTTPVRDPKKLSNFYHPSDHLPILVDFDLK